MSEDAKNTLPELLAPAGTIEAGLTAIDCGADAVYTGLPRFNARERGRNCSLDDLSKLIAYARRHDRRVYLTLNTLIKQAELPDLAALLADVYLLRPDAIIVQDLGLIRLVREMLPGLTMHASTQMAIHNSAGVDVARQLGLKRVILERQLPFAEIEKIRRATDVELEIFVHGALCCSRSGACLFSSWMGGWSGNRGRCKQPCRRRYHSDDGNGFFFSPGDLYALDAVPELKRMGVQSLKIEGRLKGADYVERVVKAYRMVLDDTSDSAEVLKEGRALLSGAFGRRWSPAFRTLKDVEGVIQHRQLGTAGQLCGSVTKARRGAFEVKLSKPLRCGDRIRVQPLNGEEGPAITVTRMIRAGRSISGGKVGQSIEVCCDKRVEPRSRVFRVGREEPDMQKRTQALPLTGVCVDLQVKLCKDELIVNLPEVNKTWRYEVACQPARKQPLSTSILCREFARSDLSAIAAGGISAEVEGELFFPAGELKKARRAFWRWVTAEISANALREGLAARLNAFCEGSPAMGDGASPRRIVILPDGRRSSLDSKARCSRPLQLAGRGDEAWLPEFCSEGRLEGVRQQLRSAVGRSVAGLRMTSLYQFALLGGVVLPVVASFSIPACNHLAVEQLTSLGAARVMAWPELTDDDLQRLVARCGAIIDVYAYGRLPLLSTRMEVSVQGSVRDSRGGLFRVVKEGELTWLFPGKPFRSAVPTGCGEIIDLTHARPGEESTSFNQQRDWA